MKLHILTIVLDGMPFLPMQLACFNRLQYDWHWHISHGAADNSHDTNWCKKQPPRLSADGTTEFLHALRGHPRISIYEKPFWDGKVEMVNAGIENINEECLLLQVDADELWLPGQIDAMTRIFNNFEGVNAAMFYCRYFLGPNIISVGENCYGANLGEWLRLFKFTPGMKFERHEPPVLVGGGPTRPIARENTRIMHFVFDHWAYVFESQVAYKEKFYGYENAVEHWKRLQSHPGPWPVKLKDFLPWVDDHAQADLLHKPQHNWTRNPGDGQP